MMSCVSSIVDADGRLTCRRCKKKFSKERHFNTHKCLALSDFVDIMETELINMGEEESDDEEEVDRSRDRDFRCQSFTNQLKPSW